MIPKIAEQLARELMDLHGLSMWSFGFSRAKKTFGQVNMFNELLISRPFAELNTEAVVQDVILHEIAHALVGMGHIHDKVFKAKALEIGCHPLGIGTKAERRQHLKEVVRPEPRYRYECPNCHKIYKREKRQHKPIACKICCYEHTDKRWSERFVMVEVKTIKTAK